MIFDQVIDRHNTNCSKYDLAVQNGYPADVLPLWVDSTSTSLTALRMHFSAVPSHR